jgi:hypothetical protein
MRPSNNCVVTHPEAVSLAATGSSELIEELIRSSVSDPPPPDCSVPATVPDAVPSPVVVSPAPGVGESESSARVKPATATTAPAPPADFRNPRLVDRVSFIVVANGLV